MKQCCKGGRHRLGTQQILTPMLPSQISMSLPYQGKCQSVHILSLVFIEVELIYKVMLVSGVQQSYAISYIYIYINTFFFILFLLWFIAAAAAKSLQSCPTLCNPRDGSPPGSPVPGILQARTLEWVAISFSNAWKWKVKVKSLSRVQPSATPWTAAHQAPPSTGFSRQEDWSGCHYRTLNVIPSCAYTLKTEVPQSQKSDQDVNHSICLGILGIWPGVSLQKKLKGSQILLWFLWNSMALIRI